MKPLYPSIAICGIGSVTVTIIHAFHQNNVPFKVLCKDFTRLEWLQKNPIQFQGPNGKTTTIHLTNHLLLLSDTKETYDYIILGCKNQILPEYVNITKQYLKPEGKWILIQNGLPEGQFFSLKNQIIGGVVGWNTQTLEDGSYFQSNHGSLVLGESNKNKLEPFWKTYLEPWISVVLTEDLLGYRWHKLGINSIINGLAASKQMSLGELFLKKSGRMEAIQILSEIKHIMQKLNIKEQVVPGSFPIQKLGDGDGALPLWLRHLILFFLGIKYFKIRTSMVQDLDQKRKTEINFINGEVVRVAKENGILVPANETVVEKVLRIETSF